MQLFAPYDLFVGSAPDEQGTGVFFGSGTSYSTPFVAGVAAQVWAANPSLSADDVFNTLIVTGPPGADSSVPHRINAFDAVARALGGANNPPTVELKSPAPGSSWGYGGMGVPLSAHIADVEDELNQLTIRWSTPEEGTLGTVADMSFAFPTPGPRTITLTVTDRVGFTVTRTTRITVTNSAPQPHIDAPLGSATLYRGTPFAVNGRAIDLEEAVGGLDCSRLVWSLTEDPSAGTLTGCTGALTSSVTGTVHVVLTATDSLGAVGRASVTVNVQDPPVNSPPIVSILSPTDHQDLSGVMAQTVQATATASSGATITGYRWTVETVDGSLPETEIGTGASLEWTPQTLVPRRCGSGVPAIVRCYATDSTGATGKSEVSVSYWFGPC